MMELNGRAPSAEALRALALTNYGHFTSMRVEAGRIRGLKLHLERLRRDCQALFGTDLDSERVRELVARAVDFDNDPTVVRVTVFDPSLDIGHPATASTPEILVTTRPAPALPLPPLRVRTVPYVRDLPQVKHLALLGQLHARREAQLDGYDDALFCDQHTGRISEGGTWNVGFVDADGTIRWPQSDVLPGVTMALLQGQSSHITAPVTVADLPAMQGAFAVNTTTGVRPLRAIDDTTFPPDHPALAALQQEYLKTPAERP